MQQDKFPKIDFNICIKLISVPLFLVLFLLITIIRSLEWLWNVFGDISFSAVVYQLMSPIKGASEDILWNYIFSCVILSLIAAIFLMCAYKLLLIWLKKGSVIYAWIFRILYIGAAIGICGFLLVKAVIRAGIPEYMKEMTGTSFLYEDEYVDPNDVEILFPENKRNLILIYLESMESTYAAMEDHNGGSINYIPELTQLAMENVSFSDSDGLGGAGVYGNTGWTMAALLSSSTGVPFNLGIEGNSAGEYEDFLPGITGLGEILVSEGYTNYFMCGSDAAYGGRSAFMSQHGDHVIYDYNTAIMDGLIESDYYEFWGFEDEELYSYAQEKLTDIAASSEPFNFTILTVDTHHPNGYVCELCEDVHSQQYGNVISCASRQAYDFVLWIQNQEWYKDTLIVLVGDHLSMNMDFFTGIDSDDRKIYNCFINTSRLIADGENRNRKFSTMDMFPTIIAAMGATIEGERLGLGTNLFSGKATLAEQLPDFKSELTKYSGYYTQNFISVDGSPIAWFVNFMEKINGYNYERTWYPDEKDIWREGFAVPEGRRVWMVGDESVIDIPIEKELTKNDLEIEMSLVVCGTQQKIEISMDGQILFDNVLQGDETEISFSIPRDMINGSTVSLHFNHPDARSPKELGQGADERKLSFCIYKIRVKNK